MVRATDVKKLVVDRTESQTAARRTGVDKRTGRTVDHDRTGNCIQSGHPAFGRLDVEGTVSTDDTRSVVPTTRYVVLTGNQSFAGNHRNPATTTGSTVGSVITVSTGCRKHSVVGHVVTLETDGSAGTTSTVTSAPSVGISRGIGDVSTIDENLYAGSNGNRTITVGNQLESASTGATGTCSALTVLSAVPPTTGSTTTGSGDESVELPVAKGFARGFGSIVIASRSLACV